MYEIKKEILNICMGFSLETNKINYKEREYKQLDETLGAFKEERNNDNEIGINKDEIIVNIKCFLTDKELISPARGIKCEHLDCCNFEPFFVYVKNHK